MFSLWCRDIRKLAQKLRITPSMNVESLRAKHRNLSPACYPAVFSSYEKQEKHDCSLRGGVCASGHKGCPCHARSLQNWNKWLVTCVPLGMCFDFRRVVRPTLVTACWHLPASLNASVPTYLTYQFLCGGVFRGSPRQYIICSKEVQTLAAGNREPLGWHILRTKTRGGKYLDRPSTHRSVVDQSGLK